MPQETTHIMTTYEMIATAIAILALLQPWIIKLWDRFFRKIHVNFIPTAKIKLYYNRSGAYVYLGGVIESKNKAAIVKDIAISEMPPHHPRAKSIHCIICYLQILL